MTFKAEASIDKLIHTYRNSPNMHPMAFIMLNERMVTKNTEILLKDLKKKVHLEIHRNIPKSNQM